MTNLRKIAVLGILSLLAAACGGSGGVAASPGGAGATAKTSRGAITAASASTITVNGIPIATAGATVRVDDHGGGRDDLRPGAVVRVRGTFDDRSGSATEIEVEHAIEGRVDDKGTDFIVVAGQRIQVDDSTHFDDHGLDAIGVGSVVQVSGAPVAGTPGAVDDRGGLRASRIDRSPRDGGSASDDHDLDVKGFVSALDTGAKTFQLRASPDAASYDAVSYAGISLPAGIVNGSYVEVHTVTAPVAGTAPVLAALVASSIALEDGLQNSEVEIEGYVTSLSGSRFVVAGTTVEWSAATRFVLGTSADLVVGAKLEVEGSVDASGVLHAEKVSFRAGVRITAVIESYTGSSMTLLGVVVQIPSFVRNDVGALANGLKVEVRGSPAADGLGVVALRIGPGTGGGNVSRVFLRAVVTEADASAQTLKVLGFTVAAAGASLQIDPDSDGDGSNSVDVSASPGTFWAAVDPGRTVVKVRASSAASVDGIARTWVADEVEIDGDE